MFFWSYRPGSWPRVLNNCPCQSEGAKSKLQAAGANSVESPYEMGAASMAHRIIRPTVTNFIDLAMAHTRKDIQMEEIPVSESSKLTNVALKGLGYQTGF